MSNSNPFPQVAVFEMTIPIEVADDENELPSPAEFNEDTEG